MKKDIPGYEGLYQVSADGEVFSLGRTTTFVGKYGVNRTIIYPARKMTRTVTDHGYYKVMLTNAAGKRRGEYVHRLVCRAFHGEGPQGTEVAHNDGNGLNCRVDNLRWATRTDNIGDQIKHGTKTRGERVPQAKLTEADVKAIRSDVRRQAEIAKAYGVDQSQISEIKSRKAWSHVE